METNPEPNKHECSRLWNRRSFVNVRLELKGVNRAVAPINCRSGLNASVLEYLAATVSSTRIAVWIAVDIRVEININALTRSPILRTDVDFIRY